MKKLDLSDVPRIDNEINYQIDNKINAKYSKVLDKLESIPLIPSCDVEWDLNNISNALRYIGNIHLKYKRIQVVGTNGKGTTAYFLSHILKNHHLKVGLYISPHFVTIRERIQINNNYISERSFGDVYESLECVFERFKLTHFERLTLIAAKYFFDQKVDIAIFETGMGGRLDATTALRSQLALFTSISVDHTEYLGNSIEQITQEKAWVIMSCESAIAVKNSKRVDDILTSFANQQNKELFFIPSVNNYKYLDKALYQGTEFEFANKVYQIPMYGKHYAKNSALAISAAEYVLEHNYNAVITPKIIEKLSLRFRLELIKLKNNRQILFSCAHNIASIERDLETINELIQNKIIGRKLSILFGVSGNRPSDIFLSKIKNFSKDLFKEVSKEVSEDMFEDLFVTQVDIYKDPYQKIKNDENDEGDKKVTAIENSNEAIDHIINNTDQSSTILIIGSIYLCGEVFKIFRKFGHI